MVVLHEQHLRAFLDAWNQAKASGVPLPQVADPDYMLPAKHCCAQHVVDKWRTPLALITEDRFESPEFPSRWKVEYCIDAMLEHAVMHPVRHRFQLVELMAKD